MWITNCRWLIRQRSKDKKKRLTRIRCLFAMLTLYEWTNIVIIGYWVRFFLLLCFPQPGDNYPFSGHLSYLISPLIGNFNLVVHRFCLALLDTTHVLFASLLAALMNHSSHSIPATISSAMNLARKPNQANVLAGCLKPRHSLGSSRIPPGLRDEYTKDFCVGGYNSSHATRFSFPQEPWAEVGVGEGGGLPISCHSQDLVSIAPKKATLCFHFAPEGCSVTLHLSCVIVRGIKTVKGAAIKTAACLLRCPNTVHIYSVDSSSNAGIMQPFKPRFARKS